MLEAHFQQCQDTLKDIFSKSLSQQLVGHKFIISNSVHTFCKSEYHVSPLTATVGICIFLKRAACQIVEILAV
jgi:hypothetical protein